MSVRYTLVAGVVGSFYLWCMARINVLKNFVQISFITSS